MAWEGCAKSIGAAKVPAPPGAAGRVVCPRRASGQAPQYLRDKGAKRIRSRAKSTRGYYLYSLKFCDFEEMRTGGNEHRSSIDDGHGKNETLMKGKLVGSRVLSGC